MNEKEQIENLEKLIINYGYSEKSLNIIRDDYEKRYKNKPIESFYTNYKYQLTTMFKTLNYGRKEC